MADKTTLAVLAAVVLASIAAGAVLGLYLAGELPVAGAAGGAF